MIEHEKGLGRAKQAMFIPLHNTHMHILLVYSDKIRTRNMAMPRNQVFTRRLHYDVSQNILFQEVGETSAWW